MTKDFLDQYRTGRVINLYDGHDRIYNGYKDGNALLASTMAFATLCCSRLFHGFNCKSNRPVVFTKRVFNNIYLIGAFVIGMILITLVVTVPGLHNIFKVQTLTLSQLLTVYGLAALNLPIIQTIKAIRAKVRKIGGTTV